MRKRNHSLIRAGVLAAVMALPLPVVAQAPGELERMEQFLGIMGAYFDIIEATHDITASPEKAAIFQMQKIQEVYEERGEKARAIEVFKQVLEQTQNPTIRNAAYIMLGDALKETGRADEAVRLLQEGLKENLKNAQ